MEGGKAPDVVVAREPKDRELEIQRFDVHLSPPGNTS